MTKDEFLEYVDNSVIFLETNEDAITLRAKLQKCGLHEDELNPISALTNLVRVGNGKFVDNSRRVKCDKRLAARDVNAIEIVSERKFKVGDTVKVVSAAPPELRGRVFDVRYVKGFNAALQNGDYQLSNNIWYKECELDFA